MTLFIFSALTQYITHILYKTQQKPKNYTINNPANISNTACATFQNHTRVFVAATTATFHRSFPHLPSRCPRRRLSSHWRAPFPFTWQRMRAKLSTSTAEAAKLACDVSAAVCLSAMCACRASSQSSSKNGRPADFPL